MFQLSVKATYAYEAQGCHELGLKDGKLIELSSGPSGGQFYGEGWWEGEWIIMTFSKTVLTLDLG
ncbi:hypothetical protein F5878DRAFT_606669 [Lentinula raphanica]|uniref:SH3 domain-containing protein n=1 Tax=Lentinula raphanica TaxID=153919 RepID=A0AA38UIN2_9AGAR|nr:hypothetical protein F5878DRAFT_606669 [Lentinula raphanica]